MYFVPHFGHAKVYETSIWTPCFQISAKTLVPPARWNTKALITPTGDVLATNNFGYISNISPYIARTWPALAGHGEHFVALGNIFECCNIFECLMFAKHSLLLCQPSPRCCCSSPMRHYLFASAFIHIGEVAMMHWQVFENIAILCEALKTARGAVVSVTSCGCLRSTKLLPHRGQ